MTPMQVARQIANLTATAVWPDGGAEVIVGDSVYVTMDAVDTANVHRFPFAVVRPTDWTSDPEAPDLGIQKFHVAVVTNVQGDSLGQHALTGGTRSGDSGNYGKGSSKGRGILEIEPAITSAWRAGLGPDGLGIMVGLESASEPESGQDDQGRSLIARRYALSARCTLVEEYPAPREFTATGGVGTITCAWTNPPPRFDRRQNVLRYASGATAPTSATAGTGGTLASDMATSVVLSLAAGTYSLALFTGYNPNGRAANEHFSSQETGTTRLSVTVS